MARKPGGQCDSLERERARERGMRASCRGAQLRLPMSSVYSPKRYKEEAMGPTASMNGLLNTHSSTTLQASFWDAMLLAGLPDIGLAGSVMIAFGVAVSFWLQLLFCWIVVTSFLSGDAKYDIQYLKEWRILYGHSVSFFDHTSGASLVSKVCQGRPFEREWWNNALISEINAYLTPVFPTGSNDGTGFTVGVVLSAMAITIWACHITTELQSVSSFGMAILRLPRGRTEVSQDAEGNRAFESISRRRLLVLGFVVIARFGIAVMLGISGGMWLCQTRDVTNIMLNAVALLFILEIDDLLYSVLAPKHAMKYLNSIKEFETGSRKTWAGIDLSCILKLVMLVCTVTIFIRYGIYINALQAQTARMFLCGGNQNFVYGSHKTLGPLFLAETEDFNLTRAQNMLPGMMGLVEDVVFNFHPEKVKDYMWRTTLERGDVAVKHVPSVEEMEAWLSMSDTEAPEETAYGSRSYGTFCEDKPWDDTYWEADWVWSTLQVLTGATNCAEAKPYCDKKTLPLLRMVCPQTCGCTRADSGLYVDKGCRKLCQEESEFKQSLNQSTCADWQAGEEARKNAWRRWWKGFYDSNKGIWKEGNEMMAFARNGARGNCSFVTSEDWIPKAFCMDGRPHRPASFLCPQTCGCNSSQEEKWCPVSSRCANPDTMAAV
ncbi:unnamed protein product [Effrenium voratum]|nr:unnamed protein product [Effrenium voratum]